MKIAYTHLGNVDSFKSRRYHTGDRLICYERACEVAVGETATSVAERMFALHSGEVDDPEAWSYPAIGIGDVLVIGEVAVGVTETGLEPTEYDPVDVISAADWIEFLFPGVAGRLVRGLPQPRDCRRRVRAD
jgi:hypothetical protein